MDFIKKNIKYLLLFIFFFVVLWFICFENTSFDFLWSYGFSHAIRIGEIPYKNFNTIVTPLYIFIMSIGLFIKDSFLTFIVEQALFSTLLFYIIFKYVGRKGWIMLPILSFPFFVSFIGTYNFLALLLIVLLFYLEDIKKSDYLIGILLGLLILSKQTIGGVALLFNFVFLHDLKRILKRFYGLLLPLSLFFIYLLITNSFNNFIDLCFLGLLDFGKSNGGLKIFTIISFAMLLGIFIYYYKIRDIKCSYLIGAFFFPFPIFDYSHFNLFLSLCILLIISVVSVKNEKKIVIISFILLIVILFFNILVKSNFYNNLVFLNLNHFEHYLVQNADKDAFLDVYSEYKKYDNAMMIGTQAMLYDIASNNKITYYDMPLTGNYGYNGTLGMISNFNNIHDKYVFINMCQYNILKDTTQLDYKLIKYVINNSKFVTKSSCYNVYYKD